MPDIPQAPPPPPQLAGLAAQLAMPAPTTPPVAPPPPPPAPPKLNGEPLAIPFPAGSAVLPADALAPIKLLAGRRGAANIAVTGFGEAPSNEPAAQAAALPLALDRARAVAAMLMANGVPGAAIRIAAEPQGSGAAARLVN
jgi:outer membrane protein OmpA-like peptidoglycan-associated protein